MSEPILNDIAKQLNELRTEVKQELGQIKQGLTQVRQRLDTFVGGDSASRPYSMRIVSTNQTAFFGVGIALLSAVIAFVVARLSGGSLK